MWELLGRPASDGNTLDQARDISGCMMPDEAASLGVGFSHYAYVTPEQVMFKAKFYGYESAVRGWEALQLAMSGDSDGGDGDKAGAGAGARPNVDAEATAAGGADSGTVREAGVRLALYFPWLSENNRFRETFARRVTATPLFELVPPVQPPAPPPPRPELSGSPTPTPIPVPPPSPSALPVLQPKGGRGTHVVVDMVIFQQQPSAPRGIARVWSSILPLLAQR